MYGTFSGDCTFFIFPYCAKCKKALYYNQYSIGGGSEMPKMRLDKLLSHLNCGSRKEVQSYIRAGRVAVCGTVERDPAAKVDPDTDSVSLDGREQTYREQRYYMLNKPAGVITASRDERHDTVLELFPEKLRRGLFAVGRLDKDTEGLLLVTDDGALSHALMSPTRHVSKVYEAEIDGELVPDAAERFASGLTLRDGTECRPATLEQLPDGRVRVTLHEGKYHQVKRMIAACSNRCDGLHRSAFGLYVMPETLKQGEWVWLTKKDLV